MLRATFRVLVGLAAVALAVAAAVIAVPLTQYDESSDRPADERFAEAPQARIRGPTFYNRKAKYDRTDVSDAISPKALDDENAKLNKLLADPILDARL